MKHTHRRDVIARSTGFVARRGAQIPVLLAPMAGVNTVALSSSVINAGGVGGCGALLMTPEEILAWAHDVRQCGPGPFQINLWVPSPEPTYSACLLEGQRTFLSEWGPVPATVLQSAVSPFDEQFEALLTIRPAAISSIMGLFSERHVAKLKSQGIEWWATVTSTDEALLAQRAGADAVIVQGSEAGGHRGAFSPEKAGANLGGLIALVPRVCDLVDIPVIAAGGIADGRSIAAALVLGASAVQIGTGFLRTPEAQVHPAYAREIAHTEAHGTCLTRVYSGRTGRAISNHFTAAASQDTAPEPLPYPLQRQLTQAMRVDAEQHGDVERMQMWAGQAAALARALPAADLVARMWQDSMTLIGN
ncbi:MAG TPA: nitronate monooxygenase [Acidobacteriaceae bacterium]|nr:nitronate monooxygenase [Acidobacteriaceae bacterium]